MKPRVANKFRGLCSTCAQAKNCRFPRAAGAHIYHCDEWKGTVETPRKKAARPRRGGEVRGERTGAKLIGLCRDCGKLKACTFTRPEGGVWHCEEYD
jgi:hypothetical protein